MMTGQYAIGIDEQKRSQCSRLVTSEWSEGFSTDVLASIARGITTVSRSDTTDAVRNVPPLQLVPRQSFAGFGVTNSYPDLPESLPQI